MARLLPLLATIAAAALLARAAPVSTPIDSHLSVIGSYGFDRARVTLALRGPTAPGARRELVVASASHPAQPLVISVDALSARLARGGASVTESDSSVTLVVLTRERTIFDGAHADAQWHANTWHGVQELARAAYPASATSFDVHDVMIDAFHASLRTDQPLEAAVVPLLAPPGALVLAVTTSLRVPVAAGSAGGQASVLLVDAIADAVPGNSRVAQVPLDELNVSVNRDRDEEMVAHNERARRHVANVAVRLLQRASRAAARGPEDGGDDDEDDLHRVVGAVTAHEIKKDVQYLTGEAKASPLTSRHAMSDGYKQAAAWVKAQFERAGCDSASYMPFRTGYGPNVVCEFKGAELPDEIVVLGSHLDSRGSLFIPYARAPGADDDASGSSMMLAAMRHFAASPYRAKVKRTVRFISFGGEEQGLVGSRAYAKAARERGDKIAFMLQADMVGYHAPGEPMQLAVPAAHASPEANLLVAAVAREYAPELVLGETKACCSDHQSFYEQGYQSTQIFERNGPIADPMYHNRGDLSKRPGYDFEQIVEHTKVALATIISVAETADERE